MLPLSPAQLLVGTGKVLGGECPQKRELPGKDGGADDFSEFSRIRSGRGAAACHSEEP